MDIDNEILKLISTHLQDTTELMYLGPDYGAHYPYFFCQPSEIQRTYMRLKKTVTVLRFTSSLYRAPHRNMSSATKVWCLGQDFDFDRNGWEGVPRKLQEETLEHVCDLLPPTFCTKTRNGYHLFWMLREPTTVMEYSYISNMLHVRLKSDPHSIVPVHCLSARARNRKPSSLSDRIQLPVLETELLLYPHQLCTYTLDEIHNTLGSKVTPALRNLNKMLHISTPYQKRYDGIDNKATVDFLLEQYDILNLLRAADTKARASGTKKITMCCPYHHDRNPSAFLNLNSTSDHYGFFHCVSCGKTTFISKLLTDLGVL